MKKILILSLIVLFAGRGLYAQCSEHFRFDTYLSNGYQQLNIPALNDSLTAGGWPAINESQYALGYGARFWLKRFFTGIEMRVCWANSDQQQSHLEMFHFLAELNFGYDVIPNSQWDLYPFVGLESTDMRLFLHQEPPISPGFNNVFSGQEYNETNLNHMGVSYTLGLGLNRRFLGVGILGLSASYTPTMDSKDWYMSSYSIEDGPAVSPFGLSVNLSFGLSIGGADSPTRPAVPADHYYNDGHY